jgi:hypothetical protein
MNEGMFPGKYCGPARELKQLREVPGSASGFLKGNVARRLPRYRQAQLF